MASRCKMLLFLLLVLALVHVTEQSYRGMYLYQEIDLEPLFYECRHEDFNNGSHVLFAAIHITDNRTFENPCYCDIFTSDDVIGINIKTQPEAAPTNEWFEHSNLTVDDWEGLGYRGLKIRALSDSVEFYTMNHSFTVSIPISIEVAAGNADYMQIMCQNEDFAPTTTTTTTKTTTTTTTTTTTPPTVMSTQAPVTSSSQNQPTSGISDITAAESLSTTDHATTAESGEAIGAQRSEAKREQTPLSYYIIAATGAVSLLVIIAAVIACVAVRSRKSDVTEDEEGKCASTVVIDPSPASYEVLEIRSDLYSSGEVSVGGDVMTDKVLCQLNGIPEVYSNDANLHETISDTGSSPRPSTRVSGHYWETHITPTLDRPTPNNHQQNNDPAMSSLSMSNNGDVDQLATGLRHDVTQHTSGSLPVVQHSLSSESLKAGRQEAGSDRTEATSTSSHGSSDDAQLI